MFCLLNLPQTSWLLRCFSSQHFRIYMRCGLLVKFDLHSPSFPANKMSSTEENNTKKDEFELLLAIIHHVGSDSIDFKEVAKSINFEGTAAVPAQKGL